MPGPLLIPGIMAGANLLGQGISAISQGRQNRLAREWQEKMYGVQRQDALADWQMQNQYNHPSSQMARLREAGLNPNLVYGNGAVTPTAQVRSSNAGNWHPTAPKIDLGEAAGSGLMAYMDLKVKNAQVDNLRANNTILLEEAMNRVMTREKMRADMMKTMTDTEKTAFELRLKQELAPYQIEAAQLQNIKTAADTKMTLDENDRRQIMLQPTVQKMLQETLNIMAQRNQINATTDQIKQLTENAKIEQKLKQLELELAQKGIYVKDPWYIRIFTRVANAGMNVNALEDAIQEVINEMKKRP